MKQRKSRSDCGTSLQSVGLLQNGSPTFLNPETLERQGFQESVGLWDM